MLTQRPDAAPAKKRKGQRDKSQGPFILWAVPQGNSVGRRPELCSFWFPSVEAAGRRNSTSRFHTHKTMCVLVVVLHRRLKVKTLLTFSLTCICEYVRVPVYVFMHGNMCISNLHIHI